jgi:hypothetical protein
MIDTPRLRLHNWDDRHREAFATMHADPEVMADYRGLSTGPGAVKNSSNTLPLNAQHASSVYR